ncbi:hypothetical protein GOODEAATRI_018520 [Goodea atripinnis]|uniref:Secreted protein n=1 Tax=Goodea atripinnis TaxID=208336 RepID=A0ABV0NVP0_9TELE
MPWLGVSVTTAACHVLSLCALFYAAVFFFCTQNNMLSATSSAAHTGQLLVTVPQTSSCMTLFSLFGPLSKVQCDSKPIQMKQCPSHYPGVQAALKEDGENAFLHSFLQVASDIKF